MEVRYEASMSESLWPGRMKTAATNELRQEEQTSEKGDIDGFIYHRPQMEKHETASLTGLLAKVRARINTRKAGNEAEEVPKLRIAVVAW